MRALVISGGGSKGAFAGGVAQYLIDERKKEYDLFLGTSTGSLMLTHLALGKTLELQHIYSNVDQDSIFSICPFNIKKYKGHTLVGINHFNTIRSFIKGSKTFGESKHLKNLIDKHIKDEYLSAVKESGKKLLITVSNLTLNQVEFKDLANHTFDDFRDFMWASSNFVPFMSLLVKDNYEYADGGFANMVPIREAIRQGATEIDAIILETEVTQLNRMPSKNPFSLINNLFNYMQIHIEKHNISIGKLAAENRNVQLNLYYTPIVLTTNSLVFQKENMRKWWKSGFDYAHNRLK
ncbi:patatin-like phospholipase family protein [Lutimonas saemankumensis]|uniref:patatin-like phospholipase family protein n=1 Tax=Lutimonas saemankumensis TaxID=483016 RepID=UPI001CD5FF19|nr:patatin-like phospholipase family protein [Lutimonas saemankumensis]MCA0931633.1 patatin-like phospholipase family protein [Lutimonas saemankumensis]